MLRKRLISLIAGIIVMLAVTGVSGIVADSLALTVTPHAYACEASGSAGGGC
jgi:hypothetical protein